MFHNSRTTPRGLILAIDLVIVFFSVILSYLLRFNFNIPANELHLLPHGLIVILFIRLVIFLITKSFSGIIRYTEVQDVSRIFFILLIGTILIGSFDFAYYHYEKLILIPRAIIVIEFISSAVGLILFRLAVKTTYWELKKPDEDSKNMVIFGAGEAAVITLRALKQANNSQKVIAFFDDSKNKQGKKIENIEIISFDHLEKIHSSQKIDTLIISSQNIEKIRRNQIAEKCLQLGIKVKYVPAVSKWINGELSANQIKSIDILELLERDEIQLSKEAIAGDLRDKTIWVTGGAGSIGSEIVRQLAQFSPNKIVVIDTAETPIFHLELELKNLGISNVEYIIGDVRNEARMRKAFKTFPPQQIYHAAAYKHVPLMEKNPSEAIFTNVNGTKIMADLAHEFEVAKFVMISTDKAVNPTNVMGASKRIAEIYVQSLNQISKTAFITTRFGNVLGSNGSVIPLFTKQIQEGGPITLTHPEITRFFMTIPEACQLVLEAGHQGKGGEIFVFDMGKSVKIIDLARKMIRLSGLEENKDIQIIYTGLRPGEKLYEELLANEENTLPTSNPKIMIAKVRVFDFEEIKQKINNLITLFDEQNNLDIVGSMKEIVPEYLSQNSEFENLDK